MWVAGTEPPMSGERPYTATGDYSRTRGVRFYFPCKVASQRGRCEKPLKQQMPQCAKIHSDECKTRSCTVGWSLEKVRSALLGVPRSSTASCQTKVCQHIISAMFLMFRGVQPRKSLQELRHSATVQERGCNSPAVAKPIAGGFSEAASPAMAQFA